ncbi:hypothetical protein LX87_01926 [Larkinella arboricola]|uniref:Uncharacterized protein n=1 Tax=Larkinella arboricola TaxID=643671 RepID=A0A327X1I7_LARAB|nr:hypothetical protein [Larkinella arboricola]RAK00228.1 hypothetical protein LX87_01926 [Larkinella arboricola]
MIKAVKKYLLTLGIFLLSGYGFIYAFSSDTSYSYSSIRITEQAALNHFSVTLKNHTLTLKCPAVSDVKEKDTCKVFSEKSEEEDKISRFISLKKTVEISHHLPSLYTRLLASLYYQVQKHFLACHYYVFTSLSRYIILRVILL